MFKLVKLCILCCIVLTAPAVVQAASQSLWSYPCDVIMSAGCLRLPNDMSITYQVPADFGIYTVDHSGKRLLSIYAGSAPRLPVGLGRPSLTLDSKGAHITAFHSIVGGERRLDIVMAPRKGDGDTIHLFAGVSDGNREAIAMVVAGLRLCGRPAPGQFQCPMTSDVGKALAGWVWAQNEEAKPLP